MIYIYIYIYYTLDPETLLSQDIPHSRMKIISLILNTRVSLWDVGSILATACRVTAPPHIIIPDMLGSDRFKEKWEMEHPETTQLHTMNPGESISIKFKDKMEMIVISEEVKFIYLFIIIINRVFIDTNFSNLFFF